MSRWIERLTEIRQGAAARSAGTPQQRSICSVVQNTAPKPIFEHLNRLNFAEPPDKLGAADLCYLYHERAGIYEDGGRDRARAEAMAFQAALTHWLNMNPVPSDPAAGCVWCGMPETCEAMIVPFGLAPYHTWLHPECWSAWSAARRAAVCQKRRGPSGRCGRGGPLLKIP